MTILGEFYYFEEGCTDRRNVSVHREVRVMPVNHPPVGYSWDYWHKVYRKFTCLYKTFQLIIQSIADLYCRSGRYLAEEVERETILN